MFDNSISVLSRVSARIKRIVILTELVIQLMFIGYYTYLLVTNLDNVVFIIAYSILIFLATSVFFVMVFTLDPYHKKAIAFKKRIRKYARMISWLGKITVIGYNIYRLVAFGLTETGQLLLIFSVIIFFAEIALFIVSMIVTYYSQLFIYALQMDYQHLIGDNEDISDKPIGRILLTANNNADHEEEVNQLFIEHEIYDVIKQYAAKERHTVIRRRKLEKKLLRYYNYTLDYYRDNNALNDLFDAIEVLGLDKNEYPHVYVLKFFLINYIEQVYVGLNVQYIRFVLCALDYYRDTKYLPATDMVYRTIIKHLTKNSVWNKLISEIGQEKKSFFSMFKGNSNTEADKTISKKMYNDVYNIITKSIEEYEEELKKTIGGEIESIVSSTIKKKVHGSLKSKFKNIFKKKK